MNAIKNGTILGIRGRLLIGFSVVIAIFLFCVIFTLYTISTTKQFSHQVVKTDLPTFDALLDLNNDIHKFYISGPALLLTNNDYYKKEMQNSWAGIDYSLAQLNTLEKDWDNTNLSRNWLELKTLLTQVKLSQDKFISSFESGNKAAASQILTAEILPTLTKFNQLLNVASIHNQQSTSTALFDTQSYKLHQETNEILNNLNRLQFVIYILLFLGILASIGIAYFTANNVIQHINVFRQQSNRIATGDLTQTVAVQSTDELGQLGEDLNIMTKNLAETTKKITQNCHDMVSTLEEVRHAVAAQSSGATEQAASINQITSSVSEIEKSASQTMDKAKSLGEAAERTREKGQLGLDAVEQSVQGMKTVRDKVQMIAQTILELSNQTQQVGEITSVVNNLAQQSKMLALNASIEAAKAGEAGKGFSVVAVEVKNLAEQSEQSTSQVQKILEDIRHATEKAVMVTEEGTKGVDHGTQLVEQTGEIIRSLNEVIHETTVASQQIEAAVRQESAGIEQITAGMNEINQVTSTFVDSVQQTTEAMGNLATIAKNLKTYVETYKV